MKSNILKLVVATLLLSVVADPQGDALLDMKSKLSATVNQLDDWTQNQVTPCNWKFVFCDSNSNVIRVILANIGFNGILSPRIGELTYLSVLSLPGNNITGQIPVEFGNLSSLTSLILENNLLSGKIPDSLGKLSELQTLILSGNNLTSDIPESLSNLSNLNDIRLASNHLSGQIPARLFQVVRYDFTGNSLNCGGNFHLLCASNITDHGKPSALAGGSHSSNLGAILGSLGGAVVLIFAVFLLLLGMRERNAYQPEVFVDVAGEDDRKIAFGQMKRFTLGELQFATNCFSRENFIGKGASGEVYNGVLPDNTKIAVKRFTDYESPVGEAAFLREVEFISVAAHKNVLKLIGFCTTTTERLLVYPFMQNLSVAYRLRDFKSAEKVLDWPSRKRVALGTARGLEYLHEHCNPKIIHRDIKAANVLLDDDFEAVIGDFGLAMLADVSKTSVTTQIRGTMGHIAPEYISTGKSSERTDVFGYGIMLLELVTGQLAIDISRVDRGDDVLLLDNVKKQVREKQFDSIIDGNLSKNYSPSEVEEMIQVALQCTQVRPEDRPAMSEVVRMLEGEGLPKRWEECQLVQVSRGREYDDMLQRGFDWGVDSINSMDLAEMELCGRV
ncbi:putative LRR receptor-like serine/threonine-protein kinase [Platanthera zijinensis]|uniref:non-specific serine/threonine protein kinase n=1 Tax=Platanthera zijinensis TaxID=2320716 RepID=A0AAP0BLC1_9ASPA